MTLQELLIKYPEEVKAAIEIRVEENRNDRFEKWTEEDLAKYKEALTIFVEELKELTPKASETNDIILGIRFRDSWDEETDAYEYTSTCIYKLKDIQEYEVVKEFINLDVDTLLDVEIDALSEKIMKLPHIDSYGYDFTPWEEWLGLEVDMTTMKYFGLAECIADILCEMTFNGMTRESQDERRAELEESSKEMEKILALPKEEQEQYFYSWDEIKDDLEKKYGILDERTKEERERDEAAASRRIRRDGVWNFKMKQTAIHLWKTGAALA